MPRRKRTTAMRLAELGPGSRVYAYLRDSGGAGQERSIAEQRAAIEQHAAAQGWVIADFFTDERVASGDYARRSQFGALLDACRQRPPPVDGVLVYAFSRFGRDEYDSQFYRLELRRHGIQVHSVTDNIPAGPFALVFEAFIDWKNRIFLDDMSRHVRAGLRHNVLAGLAPGGTPPIGYKAVPVATPRRDGHMRTAARWVIDEELAPRVTEAFRLAADGWPYEQILASTGLPLKKSSLRSMLLNRSYLGIIKFGAEEFPGLNPLVDPETWQRVQARFTTRAQHAREATRMTSEWLLSGLAVCGECGGLMWGERDPRRNPGKGRYYRCKVKGCPVGRVPADAVERYVVNQVLDEVLTAQHMAALMAELQAGLNDPAVGEELAQLGPQIGGVKHSIGVLLDALEAGAGAATLERLKIREGELAQLESRRRDLEQRLALGAVELDAGTLGEVVAAMREQVASEEVAVARRALRGWVDRVRIWRERWEVDFAVSSVVPPRGFALLAANVLTAREVCDRIVLCNHLLPRAMSR